MRVANSVAEAYDASLQVAKELQKTAGTRLRILCDLNSWLFDDRIKSLESCVSKLDAGSGPLSDVIDLYAATVIVPTQDELDVAMSHVLARVGGTVKPPRSVTAETFLYDDIHVIAKLDRIVSPRSLSPAALTRSFEVQVRTGLQYAWWRATHDQIYKSADPAAHAWPMQRSSGQAKASLELLDGVLSDLATASDLQRPSPTPSGYQAEPRKWLDLWPRSEWPTDIHRYTTSVNRLLEAVNARHEDVESELRAADFNDVVGSRDISPVQAVVIALWEMLDSHLSDALVASSLRVLVTPEMVALRPSLNLAPEASFPP
jgi:ppGpp synthetase/RelA/SpoT-type nucleotidyltranferase